MALLSKGCSNGGTLFLDNGSFIGNRFCGAYVSDELLDWIATTAHFIGEDFVNAYSIGLSIASQACNSSLFVVLAVSIAAHLGLQ